MGAWRDGMRGRVPAVHGKMRRQHRLAMHQSRERHCDLGTCAVLRRALLQEFVLRCRLRFVEGLGSGLFRESHTSAGRRVRGQHPDRVWPRIPVGRAGGLPRSSPVLSRPVYGRRRERSRLRGAPRTQPLRAHGVPSERRPRLSGRKTRQSGRLRNTPMHRRITATRWSAMVLPDRQVRSLRTRAYLELSIGPTLGLAP